MMQQAMVKRVSKQQPHAEGAAGVNGGRRREAKKASNADTSSSATSIGGAPPRSKKGPRGQLKSEKAEALRVALANAFSNTPVRENSSVSEVDEYGKGTPTDRLQFGYAPAVAAEAVAFHAAIPAKTWIAARCRQFRTAIIKKQQLTRPNCESIVSVLKLKHHWRSAAEFVAEIRGRGGVGENRADEVLEMLISRQRLA